MRSHLVQDQAYRQERSATSASSSSGVTSAQAAEAARVSLLNYKVTEMLGCPKTLFHDSVEEELPTEQLLSQNIERMDVIDDDAVMEPAESALNKVDAP